MASQSEEAAQDIVSKVTFSPVSDSTGNQALIVSIKSVVGEVPRITNTPKPRSMSLDSKRILLDTKRKTRSRISPNNKSTMTEKLEEVSAESQASAPIPEATMSSTEGLSSLSSERISNPTTPRQEHASSPKDSPCLRHAAENITRKASTIESEKVLLCNNCSKSMLSYIFVVQDFLESLAKEICGNADSQDCLQCLRHEARIAVSPASNEVPVVPLSAKRSSKTRSKEGHLSKKREDKNYNSALSHTKEHARDTRIYEETPEQQFQRSVSKHRQDHQQDMQGHIQNANTSLPRNPVHEQIYRSGQVADQQTQENSGSRDYQSGNQYHQESPHSHQGHHVSHSGQVPHRSGDQTSENYEQRSHSDQRDQQVSYQTSADLSNSQSQQCNTLESVSEDQAVPFRRPIHRQRPDFIFNWEDIENRDHSTSSVPSPFSDGVDGIVSTLSNVDREVYDAARNGAGWEGLTETQERLVSSSPIPSEAYVTMCRNNAEALGCLVVGTSLLLSRTSRTLCVVVTDGVSNAFRGPLSSVFHVVQCVRSMDSLGTTKLALLQQPELGVSFDKLNVWRLVQFNKCVYLNPDTLVIQNCDELFCRDELSAVADIGWPDCFNSGVFVFTPSLQTFWQMIEHAERQGSYDGGDQGLLNSYFSSWSEDISKKLSFIYNLMANVSYTYTPAFKQFGRNVKVVQFHGSSKPWHVKFHSRTGQISSETLVHPTYVQFVHIWINIFRISAIRQMPQDIKSYAQSQDHICAVELLRFYPLPTESEAEFFLTPPSVRLNLAERKLHKNQHRENIQRRKSAEVLTRTINLDDITKDGAAITLDVNATSHDVTISGDGNEKSIDGTAISGDGIAILRDGVVEVAEAIGEEIESVKPVNVENPLPGAEIGDFQGMKAWEQGRMDYQGTDSSDTIIKRLEFLMSQPK